MPTDIILRRRRWKPGAWNAVKRLYAIAMGVAGAALLVHAERVMRQVWVGGADGQRS